MLDWTTSFLSDETIIEPGWETCQTLSIEILYLVPVIEREHKSWYVWCRKMPRIPAGHRRKPEATPVALEDQPY